MTDLATFERAAYGRAPNRVDLLADILIALATGKIVDEAAAGAVVPDPRLLRLAAAISAVMAEPRLSQSPIRTPGSRRAALNLLIGNFI